MPDQKNGRNSGARASRQSGNRLLDALPAEDFKRLEKDLENVRLIKGEHVHLPDELIDYVYFPEKGMISVIVTTPDGEAAEAGVAGPEGSIGMNVVLGVDSTPFENTVQLPGTALRIKTAAVRREFARGEAFNQLMLRYFNGMLLQISQTALCNRLHTIEQRLARWLLMSHDRAGNDELQLTQDFLSVMLGTNRPTVSTTAVLLQAGGFIKYSRGKITMLDREGLLDFACECYQTVKARADFA